MEVFIDKKNKQVFVSVKEEEAKNIIKSLISQIYNENPNKDREEFYDNKGMYFTIVVNEYRTDKLKKENEMLKEKINNFFEWRTIKKREK